jgi:anti-sigma-K factor RskA
MRHPADDELLAVAEGGSPPIPHVDSCDRCRARVEALREALALVRQDEVPEPSPLFWAHFSERVRRRVAAEPAPASHWWERFGLWRPVVAAGAFVTVVAATFLIGTQAPPVLRPGDDALSRTAAAGVARGADVSEPSAVSATADTGTLANADSDAGTAAGPDGAWTLMTDLVEGLDLDSAGEAGLIIGPGSAEHAVGQLSEQERRSFAELLREELSRPAL